MRKLLGALVVAGMAVAFSASNADAARCWWNGYTWVCRTPGHAGNWWWRHHWRHAGGPWWWHRHHWRHAGGPWGWHHPHWGWGRPYAWYR